MGTYLGRHRGLSLQSEKPILSGFPLVPTSFEPDLGTDPGPVWGQSPLLHSLYATIHDLRDYLWENEPELIGDISMGNEKQTVIEAIYNQLITSWNERNASEMAGLFNEFGELIGFDGSLAKGSQEIFDHLNPIFRDHPTPPFVCKVKSVQFLADNAAILRAIAGMISPGQQTINPDLNTHHTLVTIKKGDTWKIALFQNTPAQFHGRPELVERMTSELNELL